MVNNTWLPSSKEPAWQCRRHKRHGSDSWVGKIPWRRDLLEKGTHSNILAWRIHGQRSLVGYSPWVTKSRTRLKQLSTHIKNTIVSDLCLPTWHHRMWNWEKTNTIHFPDLWWAHSSTSLLILNNDFLGSPWEPICDYITGKTGRLNSFAEWLINAHRYIYICLHCLYISSFRASNLSCCLSLALW